MQKNRYKYFRWTPRTATITFMYVIVGPAIVGYIGYKTQVSDALGRKRAVDKQPWESSLSSIADDTTSFRDYLTYVPRERAIASTSDENCRGWDGHDGERIWLLYIHTRQKPVANAIDCPDMDAIKSASSCVLTSSR